jgi:hypothetical protein
MSSGRKSSVIRHIKNYNIHNGVGQVISYVDYSLGRLERRYEPQEQFGHIEPQEHTFKNMRAKIIQEVENLIVKEIARRFYDELSKNQKMLNNIEATLKPFIAQKFLEFE